MQASTGLTKDLLGQAARPDLYRVNAFRVLGLTVDATPREISEHLERLEMARRFGQGTVTLGLLGLQPSPDANAIREAAHRLRDPELRLMDELFWFWPHELGQGKTDPGLTALARGEPEAALQLWREQEQTHSEASVSVHNLAVLHHMQALDLEAKAELSLAEQEQRQRGWHEATSRWRALFGREGFWKRLAARIRELDDPRLTSETAERARAALPQALCGINAHLAVRAAERGGKAEVERQLTLLRSWGTEETAEEALREALAPVQDRLSTLCRVMEEQADADAEHANQVIRRLLEEGGALLVVLDALLPEGDLRREGTHDEVALCALRCQIPFANKTGNWAVSEELLELILPVAVGEAARNLIEQNLHIVRVNKLQGICFFCERNPPVKIHTITVAMHRDKQRWTTREAGVKVIHTKWWETEVAVPRCDECSERHQEFSDARRSGLILACVSLGVVLVPAILDWHNPLRNLVGGNLIGDGYILAGVAGIPLLLIYLGLALSRVRIGRTKPENWKHDFLPIAELEKQGWCPAKLRILPTNPNLGRMLGDWEPFRRRVPRPPGDLFLILPCLLMLLFWWLFAPLAGLAAGTPKGTLTGYRIGLLGKASTIERLVLALDSSGWSSVDKEDEGREVLLSMAHTASPADRAALAKVAIMSRLVQMLRADYGLKSQTEAPVRRAAAQLLGEAGSAARAAIPALEEATKEVFDFDVRRAACVALAKVAPEVGVPRLVEMLGGSNPQERVDASLALGDAGPAARAAVPALEKAAQDGDPRVRQVAEETLAKLAPEVGVPLLIPRLGVADSWVSLGAAKALGDAGPAARAAIPALEKATKDADRRVRWAARAALAKVAPEVGVPPLIQLLGEADSSVCVSAAEALGEVGPAARAAVPALEKAASDSSPYVRQVAKKALSRIR